MQERLLASIRKLDLMRAGERVGVAVSGGADSVALLRLLLEARATLGIVLAVVHFNHKLRGEASDADEDFVRSLAGEHGLEFWCESGDTRAYAKARGCGIEAAARELRYDFFWRLLAPPRTPAGAEQQSEAQRTAAELDRIATAHTIDDQAETVIMRFARGAGTRGLAGIHPVVCDRLLSPDSNQRPGVDRLRAAASAPSIVRPLLGFRRAQLRHFLRRAAQPWREDASNQDAAFARNRVRQEVMPKLRELNPTIEQVLSETAEIARAEEEYWRDVVDHALAGLIAEQHGRWSIRDCRSLMSLPLAMQRRVVRAWAERHGARLEFHHVEQVLELAAEEPTRQQKRVELPGNWDAWLLGNTLQLKRRGSTAERMDYELSLSVPGEVWVEPARVRVTARMAESGPRLKLCELRVRNWRPGDRYWPAHMATEKKLKELLQDGRIPAEARAHWPVVIEAATEQIVWVPGFAYPEGWGIEGEPGVVLEADIQGQY